MRKEINKRKVKIEISDECFVCDICHSEKVFPTVKSELGHYHSDEGSFDAIMFPGIHKAIGDVKYVFYICDKCFMAKVVPFLKSLGVAVDAG